MRYPPHDRQGDVLVIEIKQIPNTAKKLTHQILVASVVTGHRHEFNGKGATLYENKGNLFIEIFLESSILEHKEHGETIFKKGLYMLRRQREYDPMNDIVRWVID